MPVRLRKPELYHPNLLNLKPFENFAVLGVEPRYRRNCGHFCRAAGGRGDGDAGGGEERRKERMLERLTRDFARIGRHRVERYARKSDLFMTILLTLFMVFIVL